MAQLTVPAALLEDIHLIPNTYMRAQPTVAPVPRNPVPSSGLPGHLAHTWCAGIHPVHRNKTVGEFVKGMAEQIQRLGTGENGYPASFCLK